VAFPTDEQIDRIRKYKGHVVVTTQPAFWPVHEGTDYYYGDRAAQRYPIRKLIDGGVSVGISTDFSVSPPEYSPASIVIGIGATGGGKPQAHIPVSVKEMIHGLTVGSAATTGRKDIGKLDVGYKADIVVYEKDLYSVPPKKLTKDYPKVLETYVGGRKVF
jgi:predicted amidohydrolase YtcJ